ncbi:hypothetical protein NEDG_01615 [Nematocida displodere]|uniref:Tr-type G domain-containing protein n=1 Tax=Nematocida displodere TaxID=1805483 RepID=A0A177EJ96_9MICR|nr:hypothetical protein NEDG_01615 [Nematocida displodere]
MDEEAAPFEYVVNVVAHVNHGKTTFMDNVLEHLGVLTKSMAGEARLLDSRKDELERGMTMKLSPVSVPLPGGRITFLDTPGHLEFNSLTLSTFVLCDVSVVVVDVMKGVTERLKGLVRRAIEKDTGLVLFINKVDLLFKLSIPVDEIYYRLEQILQEIESVAEGRVEWEGGSVLLGSARDNWAMSSSSDLSLILGKPVRSKLSMKKAVGLAKQLYGLTDQEAVSLAQRVGMQPKLNIRTKPTPKDLLAHVFRFFSEFKEAILKKGSSLQNIFISPPLHTLADVVGVICANTLADGIVTSIVRTISTKALSVGETVYVLEPGVAATPEPVTVTQIMRFAEESNDLTTGTGLVGVRGLECKKRGVIALAASNEAQSFMLSQNWVDFMPIFTDVVQVDNASKAEAVRRVSLLSRCEPGMFCSVTKHNEIIIKSDGQLQMDKVKTDLEGLRYTHREQSGQYLESVERGEGLIEFKDQRYHITFLHTPLGSSPPPNALQLYGRRCYATYPENLPNELKHSISSLLQNGPFLAERVDMVCVRVEGCAETCKCYKALEPSLLQEVYLQSTPRIIANHVFLLITIPNAYVKSATAAIARSPATIHASEEVGATFLFRVQSPVQEVRALTVALRTITKGDCDVLPDGPVFFALLDSPEYEQALSDAIRQEKGLFERETLD